MRSTPLSPPLFQLEGEEQLELCKLITEFETQQEEECPYEELCNATSHTIDGPESLKAPDAETGSVPELMMVSIKAMYLQLLLCGGM